MPDVLTHGKQSNEWVQEPQSTQLNGVVEETLRQVMDVAEGLDHTAAVAEAVGRCRRWPVVVVVVVVILRVTRVVVVVVMILLRGRRRVRGQVAGRQIAGGQRRRTFALLAQELAVAQAQQPSSVPRMASATGSL